MFTSILSALSGLSKFLGELFSFLREERLVNLGELKVITASQEKQLEDQRIAHTISEAPPVTDHAELLHRLSGSQ